MHITLNYPRRDPSGVGGWVIIKNNFSVFGTVFLLLKYVGVKQGCVICTPILLFFINTFGALQVLNKAVQYVRQI